MNPPDLSTPPWLLALVAGLAWGWLVFAWLIEKRRKRAARRRYIMEAGRWRVSAPDAATAFHLARVLSQSGEHGGLDHRSANHDREDDAERYHAPGDHEHEQSCRTVEPEHAHRVAAIVHVTRGGDRA
jgi:hypothetical protein